MHTATMIGTLATAMALSLGIALTLEHLLWRGLLRGMVACMEIAARNENAYNLRALATSRRGAWQDIGRARARQ